MLNATKLRTIVTVVLFIAAYGAAADGLTLDEARKLALANSKTLAGLNLDVDAAAVAERAQRLKALPTASLSAQAQADASASQTLGASASVSASVQQTVFDGGKNATLVAIDAIASDVARANAREGYFAVLDDLDSAWYSLQAANSATSAAAAALEKSTLALTIAKARLDVGTISRTEYLKAESDLAENRTSLAQSRRNAGVYASKVASLAGLSSLPEAAPDDFTAYEELIARVAAFSDGDLDTFARRLKDAAFAANPGLAKARLSGIKAASAVKSAESAYAPTVSAGVSGGITYTHSTGSANPLTPSARASLTVTLPLDVWNARASVDAAKVSQRRAGTDAEETLRTLELEASTAAYDCVAQARLVQSSAKALEYAERYYQDTLEAFRLSAASSADLSAAAATVGADTSALISARYGFLSCLSKIRTLAASESDAKAIGLIP